MLSSCLRSEAPSTVREAKEDLGISISSVSAEPKKEVKEGEKEKGKEDKEADIVAGEEMQLSHVIVSTKTIVSCKVVKHLVEEISTSINLLIF